MRNPGYLVEIRPLTEDEGGGWLVTFPELPGCMADGETPEEALREAEDALESYIKTAEAHGDPVPQPSAYSGNFRLRVPKSMHAALAHRAEREGVSMNTLAVALLAEGMGAHSVPMQPAPKSSDSSFYRVAASGRFVTVSSEKHTTKVVERGETRAKARKTKSRTGRTS